jgi:hypothetical protein
MLAVHYRNGISLKGALLLIGDDFDKKDVSSEEAFFLNQLDKDQSILNKLSPAVPVSDASWDY